MKEEIKQMVISYRGFDVTIKKEPLGYALDISRCHFKDIEEAKQSALQMIDEFIEIDLSTTEKIAKAIEKCLYIDYDRNVSFNLKGIEFLIQKLKINNQ